MSQAKKTTSKSSKSESNSTSNLIIQMLWIGALSGIILTGVIFLFISKALLPDTSELENPKYNFATQIISADGKVIGKAFTSNREPLAYKDVNPLIVKALVATEDERFFNHSGIDARGTFRAFAFLGKKGGASTITQQLAKLFFTDRSSSFIKRSWQKLKEWVIAVEFEKRYTKEEIIIMYLNKYDFLHQSIGISTAAKTYFGKNQKDLSLNEAAVLVGMFKNPSLFNPMSNPENSAKRRNVVLKQMKRNDFLTEEQYQKNSGLATELKFKREVYYDGPAPYFRAELVKWTKDILSDPKNTKPDGSKYNIFTDGLKIHTTIDSRIQAYAEESMRDHMAKLQERYFEVWKNNDPWTHNGSGSATSEEKKQRDRYLQSDIRNSERFLGLRTAYLEKVSSKIYQKFPSAKLNDSDIFRLHNASDDKKYLKVSVKSKMFSSEQAEVYQQILDSPLWIELKTQWTKLRNRADKEFDTKTSMSVYDYKTGGEKTVTITPLDSIKYHQQILQMGSLAVDAKTGSIKAWVGGVYHKRFQYDHITSNRQVGSTFKPFIYSTAIIDQAMSPCTKLQDVKTCIVANEANFGLMEMWCPANSTNKYSGEWMDLKTALKTSTNTISVQLMKEIGNVERVRDFVENLGIDKRKIPSQPSICLGTAGLSVTDMAGAYTAFANNGTYSEPNFVTRIEDKDGKVIYSSVPEQRKAVNPAFNYVIVDLLKAVADPIKSNFISPVAGKTGTTNDYRDGWFVGFTPNLVISTWVGGDKEFIRFTRIGDGAGSKMARPMFISLLQKIEKNQGLGYDYSLQFEVPEKQIVELDCSKYEDIINKDKSNVMTKDDVFDEDF